MRRAANTVAFAYFILMAVAVTFPGVRPFNTVRPMILGIPFVFAWMLSWVVGAIFVFWYLYRVHRK